MKTYYVKNWVGHYLSARDDNTWKLGSKRPSDDELFHTKDLEEALIKSKALRKGPRQFGHLNKCRVVSVKKKATSCRAG